MAKQTILSRLIYTARLLLAESGLSDLEPCGLDGRSALRCSMASEDQSDPEYETFDPKQRAAMKQALRDKDRDDLRSGRATAEEIHKRNLFLGGLAGKRSRVLHFGPGSGTACKSPRKK